MVKCARGKITPYSVTNISNFPIGALMRPDILTAVLKETFQKSEHVDTVLKTMLPGLPWMSSWMIPLYTLDGLIRGPVCFPKGGKSAKARTPLSTVRRPQRWENTMILSFVVFKEVHQWGEEKMEQKRSVGQTFPGFPALIFQTLQSHQQSWMGPKETRGNSETA